MECCNLFMCFDFVRSAFFVFLFFFRSPFGEAWAAFATEIRLME